MERALLINPEGGRNTLKGNTIKQPKSRTASIIIERKNCKHHHF